MIARRLKQKPVADNEDNEILVLGYFITNGSAGALLLLQILVEAIEKKWLKHTWHSFEYQFDKQVAL